MIQIRWVIHEARSIDTLPYVNAIRRAGYHDTDMLYHSNFHELPEEGELLQRLQPDAAPGPEHEIHRVFVLQHTEDFSYRLGVWGCSEGYTQVRSADSLRPLLGLHNSHVILLQQDLSIPLDDSLRNADRVHVVNSFDDVVARIQELHPAGPSASHTGTTVTTTTTTTTTTTVTTTRSVAAGGDGLSDGEESVTHTSTEITSHTEELAAPDLHLPLAKRIVFVRHAQRLDEVDPEWCERAERPQDAPITDMGISQSLLLGAWVADQPWASRDASGYRSLHSMLVSPFARTVQTAHHLAERVEESLGRPEDSIPIFVEPGLAEGAEWMGNNGICRQPWHLPAEDLKGHSPRVDTSYRPVKNPLFRRGDNYPGRPVEEEEWYERCAQTAWRIARHPEHKDRTVLIVTHAGYVC